MGEGPPTAISGTTEWPSPKARPAVRTMAGKGKGRPRLPTYRYKEGVRMEIRDYIRSLATERFGASGFTAVSVEAVLRGTGVSKPMFYRSFSSKEGLIAACVEEDCTRVVQTINDTEWQGAQDLETRVRRVMNVLSLEALGKRRSGLLAGVAALEFRDVDGVVRDAALQGLGLMAECLIEVFEPLLVERARGFADRILMLVQGAGMSCVCTSSDDAARTLQDAAVEIARSLSLDPVAVR